MRTSEWNKMWKKKMKKKFRLPGKERGLASLGPLPNENDPFDNNPGRTRPKPDPDKL